MPHQKDSEDLSVNARQTYVKQYKCYGGQSISWTTGAANRYNPINEYKKASKGDIIMYKSYGHKTNLILVIVGIVFLIWFSVPVFTYGILNIGNGTGVLLSVCLIIYAVKMTSVNNSVRNLWKHVYGKILLSAIAVTASFILVFTVVMTVFIVSSNTGKPDGGATVVVLGCQVHSYGPSLMLRERLDSAYDYLSENTEAKCILSGGKGRDEPMSEAQCMYDYLVEKGIESDRLYKEEKSTNTRENLEFSKEIIINNSLNEEIVIITNDFHEYRAGRIAKSLGIESHAVPGKTALALLPTYYVRELYCILYDMIFRS